VYRRLPNDARQLPGVLRQVSAARLVIESPIVVERPQRVFGRVIADSGFLAIWFLYRNRWYDVGKFYDRQRNLVGYYCDIIKPLTKVLRTPGKTSRITDLFLDLWITKSLFQHLKPALQRARFKLTRLQSSPSRNCKRQANSA
jgi:hypothetical protein